MNAEHDQSITNDMDRFNLVQSDHQVNGILSQCKFSSLKIQLLLPGDPNVPVNEFQKDFIEESSCMVCREIPIKPKECFNCNKLICFLCELKIAYKNGQKVNQRQCPNCKVFELKNIDMVANSESQITQPEENQSKMGPGETVAKPIFQKIQNKLLNQMLGQIKVLHRCNEN